MGSRVSFRVTFMNGTDRDTDDDDNDRRSDYSIMGTPCDIWIPLGFPVENPIINRPWNSELTSKLSKKSSVADSVALHCITMSLNDVRVTPAMATNWAKGRRMIIERALKRPGGPDIV